LLLLQQHQLSLLAHIHAHASPRSYYHSWIHTSYSTHSTCTCTTHPDISSSHTLAHHPSTCLLHNWGSRRTESSCTYCTTHSTTHSARAIATTSYTRLKSRLHLILLHLLSLLLLLSRV